MPRSARIIVVLFADDATIFKTIHAIHDYSELQEDRWQLASNVTTVLRIPPPPHTHTHPCKIPGLYHQNRSQIGRP
jgi:hypothetical protein